MIPRWPAKLAGFAAAVAGVIGSGSPVLAVPQAADELAALLRQSYPQQGAVIATYLSTGGQEVVVGYNFRTSAWFHRSHLSADHAAPSTFGGEDSTGQGFGGEAAPGAGKHRAPDGTERAAVLDKYFPTLFLREILADSVALQHVERTQDGWVVTARLVRGSRIQPPKAMPPDFVAKAGGIDAFLRTVVLQISTELTVRRIDVESTGAGELGTGECSQAGFQVAETPLYLEGVRLIQCKWVSDDDAPFTLAAVEAAAVARRMADGPKRTPVPDASTPEPVPLGGPKEFGMATLRTPILLAGASLVLIAAVAWLRRRNAA